MREGLRISMDGGFTLIELLVVVLIIGILAALAVPQYFKVVEKGKAAEAFSMFADLHGAQDRYLSATGTYCTGAFTTANCPSFDLAAPSLKYFLPPATFGPGTTAPSYTLVLTRNVAVGLYGAYQVTYDVEPGVPPLITCNQANCTTDLLPPMKNRNPERGFTLVEMLVVVMIIGILARFAVPQYFKVIEKDKATEGFNLFLTLKGSQDRYMAKYGSFCTGVPAACAGLDVTIPPLHYFDPVTTFAAGGAGNQSWTLTLTRNGAPALYGAYQLRYDVEPGAAPALTCNQGNCTTDLLPAPN